MKKLIFILVFSSNYIFSELPVENFYKFTEFSNLIISPSGKYFASEVDAEKTSGVVIIERASMKVIHTQSFGKDQYTAGFRWLNNERIGIRVGKRFGGLERPKGTIFYWALNADGTKQKLIMGSLAPQRLSRSSREPTNIGWNEVIDTLDDDENHILVSIFEKASPTIYKVNIYTGSKRKVQTAPARSLLLDSDKVIRTSVGENNSNETVFYYRPSKNDEWEHHATYKFGEGSILPLAFDKDGKNLIVECSDKDNPITGICLYNPETYKLTTIYRDKTVDPAGYIWDSENEIPVGVVLHDGIPRIHWIDKEAKIGKKMRALEKTFKGYKVRIASSTKDEVELVIGVSSDRDPGGYYLFNTETNELKDLNLNRRGWTQVGQMVKNEPFSYQSRDGLTIHGFLHRPKGESTNLPLVLYVHGGPHGVRDYWGFDGEAQFLANRGFAVMQINYRGSGGYGNAFLKAGFNKWGNVMQDDLTDGVQWAIDQGIVDKDRICIYGASYGGYAAMMSASREPDLYQCAIGYVGVYDVDSFTSVGNIPGWRGGRAYLKTVIPQDDETRKAFSPTEQARKIKAAIFLIHGKDDKQAHFQNYKLMTKKLDSLGKEYKSMVKDGEEHGFYKRENVYELAEELDKFLSEHIGD